MFDYSNTNAQFAGNKYLNKARQSFKEKKILNEIFEQFMDAAKQYNQLDKLTCTIGRFKVTKLRT